MKPYKFNSDFLELLLTKIKDEDKMAMLAGDFNFNLTKYNQNKGTSNFLEDLFSSNFIPEITLPTRKTLALIDYIIRPLTPVSSSRKL